MRPNCPFCQTKSDQHPKVVRFGRFFRKSDSRWIQRFRCVVCKKGFSLATHHPCFGQNKRHFNEPVRRLLCSGVSQRRAALILGLSRTTIVRKLIFLAQRANVQLEELNQTHAKISELQFDDMETFEHSKCKPLSITLAVESGTRFILGFEVSQMPAKGKLALISRKKYGPRADQRRQARKLLFSRIKQFVHPQAIIESDENPHYPLDVKQHFPQAQHKTYKGRRGCVVGQGELKRGGFDPLFSLNHTCAKLRADINRLVRQTWCTTKKPERLAMHIAIYAQFHNQSLKTQKLAA